MSDGPHTRPFEPVSDALLLAAIDRAARHSQADGVQRSHIAEHLGFAHQGATTLGLRPQIERLTAEGALVSSRRSGNGVFGLTRTGRARLTRARRGGASLELPEAPQHRRWREARAEAARQIETISENVGRSLTEAQSHLADSSARAETWRELSKRLREECLQLGAATYCLYEWDEPDDGLADFDDAHRELRALGRAGLVI